VRYKVEIYQYEKKIERSLLRVERLLEGKNRGALISFYEDLICKGLSKARLLKYIDTTTALCRLYGKDFEGATKTDIASLVRKIEEKDCSEWTKHDYKVVLKIFFRWLKGAEDYPPEVSWIKAKRRKNSMPSEAILTEEEVKRLVECAHNMRDRALILVLYESGCRIGEILTLRVRV